MTPPEPSSVAQTTPTGHAVATVVARDYALGDITECALLRRGFNHVYGLGFGDGRRAVARLCAQRPRGAPNTDYEAALLAHLKSAGGAVAATLPTRHGTVSTVMELPEGQGTLILFEHLDGEPPGDSLRDVEATGRGLALLHAAASNYAGPPSRYVLDLPHLLGAPLQRLCAAPTMDDALRAAFAAIAGRLEERITGLAGLSRVGCHGDCHGTNNFMTDGAANERVASFFDFDDAGPGYLAYELSVYLWAMLPHKAGGELDASQRQRWSAYLAGYESVRTIAPADLDAIAAFVPVRQFWLMGEYAGRLAVWGTQAMPTSWLRKQVELLTAWESLATPR